MSSSIAPTVIGAILALALLGTLSDNSTVIDIAYGPQTTCPAGNLQIENSTLVCVNG